MTAVAGVNSASKITVVGIPDQPDSMARILHVLSRSGASVQTIVQNTAGPDSRRSDVALIVPAAQAALALAVLDAAKGTIGFQGLQHDSQVGRVSITGLGMRSSPEIFCTFLKALSDADVELDLVDISETCVGAVTQPTGSRMPNALSGGPSAWPRRTRLRCRKLSATSRPPSAPRSHTWAAISGQDITHCPAGRPNHGTSLLAKELKDGQDREDRQRPHQTPRVARKHVNDRRFRGGSRPHVGRAGPDRALAAGRAAGPAV